MNQLLTMKTIFEIDFFFFVIEDTVIECINGHFDYI